MTKTVVRVGSVAIAMLLTSTVAMVIMLPVAKEAEATFPGKNGRIAFSTREPTADAQHQIYTIKPDGTGEKQLTNTSSLYYNVNPAFSPGGTKIVWNRNSDIWIMNADGTGKKRLVVGGQAPAFSPDGTKIAFARIDPKEGDWEIYWKALDGTRSKRVTNNLSRDADPAWSPDGKKIAYEFAKAVDPDGCIGCVDWSDIFTIRPDGTGRQRLTDLPAQTDAYRPDWSPDGSRVVFAVTDGAAEKGRIETIRADGTGQQTVFAPNSLFFPSAPVFSPDGTKIAFHYESGVDIWTINLDGSGLANVTNTPSGVRSELDPDWASKPATTR
jgi:TolB protein